MAKNVPKILAPKYPSMMIDLRLKKIHFKGGENKENLYHFPPSLKHQVSVTMDIRTPTTVVLHKKTLDYEDCLVSMIPVSPTCNRPAVLFWRLFGT